MKINIVCAIFELQKKQRRESNMNNNLQIYNKLLKYFSNKTYGGTNHDNPIYGPFNFKRNRKGQHYLASENANPMIVIPQSSPLSVREFTKPEAVFGLVNICVEDGTKNIDFLPNYENYERIIVSRLYAEAAKKYFADNLSYLDRLVTPVPLYNKEPETFNDIEKIGCAFLTRVLLYTGRLVYNHSVN